MAVLTIPTFSTNKWELKYLVPGPGASIGATINSVTMANQVDRTVALTTTADRTTAAAIERAFGSTSGRAAIPILVDAINGTQTSRVTPDDPNGLKFVNRCDWSFLPHGFFFGFDVCFHKNCFSVLLAFPK
jgi:hypothetical protein